MRKKKVNASVSERNWMLVAIEIIQANDVVEEGTKI